MELLAILLVALAGLVASQVAAAVEMLRQLIVARVFHVVVIWIDPVIDRLDRFVAKDSRGCCFTNFGIQPTLGWHFVWLSDSWFSFAFANRTKFEFTFYVLTAATKALVHSIAELDRPHLIAGANITAKGDNVMFQSPCRNFVPTRDQAAAVADLLGQRDRGYSPSVLLHGPPGTGKSCVSECLASLLFSQSGGSVIPDIWIFDIHIGWHILGFVATPLRPLIVIINELDLLVNSLVAKENSSAPPSPLTPSDLLQILDLLNSKPFTFVIGTMNGAPGSLGAAIIRRGRFNSILAMNVAPPAPGATPAAKKRSAAAKKRSAYASS